MSVQMNVVDLRSLRQQEHYKRIQVLNMNIMKSCYRFMLIMGVCAPLDYSKLKILGGLIRSLIVLATMTVCVFQPCIRYFLLNISNLVDATGVGLMVSIGFFAAVSLISFSLQQNQILQTLFSIESMVKKCMHFWFFHRFDIL